MALGRKTLVLEHPDSLRHSGRGSLLHIPSWPHQTISSVSGGNESTPNESTPCMVSEDEWGSFLEGGEADPSNGRPHSVYTFTIGSSSACPPPCESNRSLRYNYQPYRTIVWSLRSHSRALSPLKLTAAHTTSAIGSPSSIGCKLLSCSISTRSGARCRVTLEMPQRRSRRRSVSR